MLSQVQQDQKDLPAAVAANQNAGSGEAVQNLAAVSTLLHLAVTSKAAAVQTATASTSASASSASSSSDDKNSGGSGSGSGNSQKKHHNHHVEGVRRWARRNLVVDDEKL